jgi:CubicO group peptidase (beta-lactamase class C family)
MALRRVTIALLVAGNWLVAADARAAASDSAEPATTVWPTQTWAASTAEAQGMQSGLLARLVDNIGATRQDSLLIIRHGHIVAEAYYAPYQAGIPHDLRSVTKSVTGTLTAIELQDGLLDSVDHPILDLFADKQITNIDDNKKAMTVQSLLDMTSGIEWQEKNYTPDETIVRMFRSPDRTAFVLNQPMSSAPGTKFYYNGGNPYVLSALITKKTGRSAFDFAKERLFAPLGIADVRWRGPDAQGVTDGESGLSLAPRDMAKIGYLYLHHGVWDGRRIIPAAWVDRVSAGEVVATSGYHYAYLWWSKPEKGAYMALGRHSQVIMVLPRPDIVAVMTGILRNDESFQTSRWIDDITGAVTSDAPLPPDPVAQSLLAASIRKAATEVPSPVGVAPDLAGTVSGKTYRLSDNTLHIKTLSVTLAGVNPAWEATVERPGQAMERFGGPIGVDGVFRTAPPARYGIDAAKGRWLSEHTFEVERRILGHAETQLWTLTFDGKTIDIGYGTTDGATGKAHGETND